MTNHAKPCCRESGCYKCLSGNCQDVRCATHPLMQKMCFLMRERLKVPQQLVDAYNVQHGTGAYLDGDGTTVVIPFIRKRA